MDMAGEFARWRNRADEGLQGELAQMEGDAKALRDAFYRDLAFGTGGLRGIVGAGPNRMNVHTVARATQGLADYLNARCDGPSVAIARDSRRMGEQFCRTVAEVLAANGVRALLYPRIEPTPTLSWAVRDLGCSAGICVTASHNPAPYNGYKVYGADGCQITTQAARDIQAAIDATDVFDGPRRMAFAEAEAAGLVQWIGEEVLDRYVEATLAQSLAGGMGESGTKEPERDQVATAPGAGSAIGRGEVADVGSGQAAGACNAGSGQATGESGGLSVVYTPLHGAGLECVTRILQLVGGIDVTVEPEQAVADGEFPTCPYPNPEVREALARGLALCAEVHPDLLLATDPDADRVGIAVPHGGDYVLLNGNEVGILLLDYICAMRAARGEDLADKVVLSTIVSSAMADELAREHGFQMRRTLTGFKYIGEQVGLLESAGQADRFMFGFEESYGYLAGAQVRDKDAMVAGMLICEMARWHRSAGRDLADAMRALYERYGFYKNGLVTVEYPGAEGAERMAAVTEGLRGKPPAAIAGLAVERVVDYADGAPMPVVNPLPGDAPQQLPPADVLEFQLEGGNKLLVRPSGTEPKVKAYAFARAADDAAADELLARLKSAARTLLG